MIQVIGAMDSSTRCIHYHGPLDVIAMKFKCCKTYYCCYECHQEAADHKPALWGKTEWSEKAILCGGCRAELTIGQYRNSSYLCPLCGIAFNPKCQNHYHLYFEEDRA
jgi:uncharacterized CHY-type Zn-finger protein